MKVCKNTKECQLIMIGANGKINTKCFWCNIVECPDCKKWMTMGYNDEYDTYFCKGCKNWLEDICDDSDCEYCTLLHPRPKNAKNVSDMFMEWD